MTAGRGARRGHPTGQFVGSAGCGGRRANPAGAGRTATATVAAAGAQSRGGARCTLAAAAATVTTRCTVAVAVIDPAAALAAGPCQCIGSCGQCAVRSSSVARPLHSASASSQTASTDIFSPSRAQSGTDQQARDENALLEIVQGSKPGTLLFIIDQCRSIRLIEEEMALWPQVVQ